MVTSIASFIARLPPGLQPAARFLLCSWLGRLLVLLLGLGLLSWTGVLVFDSLSSLVTFSLWIYAFVFVVWLLLRLRTRLLWRIRRKLIISYLLIGLVPTVLVLSFFLLSAYLVFGQMSSYILMSSLERVQAEVGRIADLAAGDVLAREAGTVASLSDNAILQILEQRRSILEPLLPKTSLIYFTRRGGPDGRLVVSGGGAGLPVDRPMPDWAASQGFRGFLHADEKYVLAAFSEPSGTNLAGQVAVTLPLRSALSYVETLTGLGTEDTLAAVTPTEEGGVRVARRDERGTAADLSFSTSPRATPSVWFAIIQFRRWEDGELDEPMAVNIYFSYLTVYNLIGAGHSQIELGRWLLYLLGILAALFLTIEVVAIFVGLVLARSITGSIHSLSLGTERIRSGDFDYQIQVRSRDQLGDLARSFNIMTASVQELLRESAEKERLEEELRIARRIQMSLLPKGEIRIPGLEVAALCVPATEVGGDYYDFIPIDRHRTALLIADVSGKGTSAALYMAELKGLVLSLAKNFASPRRLLIEANDILGTHLDGKSFITMTYAVVHSGEGTMTYARAGHNPILHLSANGGGTRILAPDGLGLALDRSGRFETLLAEEQVRLDSGDLFLFFTDGLSEAMNPKLDLFGESRLREILEINRHLPSDELKERIIDAISLFADGEQQHDDMTLMLVRVE